MRGTRQPGSLSHSFQNPRTISYGFQLRNKTYRQGRDPSRKPRVCEPNSFAPREGETRHETGCCESPLPCEGPEERSSAARPSYLPGEHEYSDTTRCLPE